MSLEKLKKEFEGRGETRDFKFKQITESPFGYIYEVKSSTSSPHYEVFKKKTFPVCLDFKKRIYSETDTKENYPKKNAFGVTAWTAMSLERAEEILLTFKTITTDVKT